MLKQVIRHSAAEGKHFSNDLQWNLDDFPPFHFFQRTGNFLLSSVCILTQHVFKNIPNWLFNRMIKPACMLNFITIKGWICYHFHYVFRNHAFAYFLTLVNLRTNWYTDNYTVDIEVYPERQNHLIFDLTTAVLTHIIRFFFVCHITQQHAGS